MSKRKLRPKLTLSELAEAAESNDVMQAAMKNADVVLLGDYVSLERCKWSALEPFNRGGFDVEAYNTVLENGLPEGSR
jgi:hypothetical protein